MGLVPFREKNERFFEISKLLNDYLQPNRKS